ncbi:hypothetical protein LBMAG52_05170 [Planctomycetia bacterium]|nr:hypothetical protein LBMAG52_05170 [Planctomycetia bacterium]
MAKGLTFRVNQKPIGEVVRFIVKVNCPFDEHGNQRGLTEPVAFEIAIRAFPPDAELLRNHGKTTGARTLVKEMDFGIADNFGVETHHFDLRNVVIDDWKYDAPNGPQAVPLAGLAVQRDDQIIISVRSAQVTLHANGLMAEFNRGAIQPGQ